MHNGETIKHLDSSSTLSVIPYTIVHTHTSYKGGMKKISYFVYREIFKPLVEPIKKILIGYPHKRTAILKDIIHKSALAFL